MVGRFGFSRSRAGGEGIARQTDAREKAIAYGRKFSLGCRVSPGNRSADELVQFNFMKVAIVRERSYRLNLALRSFVFKNVQQLFRRANWMRLLRVCCGS